MSISHVKLSAPADSPNTDGIHIGTSRNIKISKSVIGTGDDCVSMVSGSQSIEVNGVACGPGHGISIGCLGRGHEHEYVKGITGHSSSAVQIQDVTFKNIFGVSSTEVAVNLQCSKAMPCKNVKLINIDLAYDGPGRRATSLCSNVIASSSGKLVPGGCI
ncbi:hypothetical protein SASPL_147120 [Salvia splendens]|uniref:Polygalacturonase n=1 Tax=Salvia splendens TaxID=180675 RepID=A0A8X8Z5J2_SALSN|nr:exopolygalacturonase clone GBGA483-like [Salvia splendens]KAG6392892.1 hypothetical protein SASPL_147120 [Salvia splendens]